MYISREVKNGITKTFLVNLFTLENGKLFYKNDSGNGIKYKGDQAGWSDSLGYKRVKINNKMYFVHRLVFFLGKGYFPKFIDHIDNNPANNVIGNLRECTHSENMMNKCIQINNTSGIKGVNWNTRLQKWVARISVNGVRKYLGVFDTIENAKIVIDRERSIKHGTFAKYR